MTWIVSNIGWIMIASGGLTRTMIHAAIAPQAAPAVHIRRHAGLTQFFDRSMCNLEQPTVPFAHYAFDIFKRSRAVGMQGSVPLTRPPLASEGMRFTDYYAEPKCTAGRANFTTGGVPDPHGLTTAGQAGSPILPDQAPTIAMVKRERNESAILRLTDANRSAHCRRIQSCGRHSS